MTNEELLVIRKLRDEGHAITLFTPEELGNANPRRVENRLVELGNEAIEELKLLAD